MKEKNTEKESVYGLPLNASGHSDGTLTVRDKRPGSYPKFCYELLIFIWSHYFILLNFSFPLIHGTRKW